MVKKNKEQFCDLLMLRKVGFGKTGMLDYRFIIDKKYKARVEVGISQEMKSGTFSSCYVLLSEDEKKLLDKFITRFVAPEKSNLPFYDEGETEKYEREELYYKDIIVDDEGLLNRFHSIIDYLQSEYNSLSDDVVSSMFSNVNNCLNVKK